MSPERLAPVQDYQVAFEEIRAQAFDIEQAVNYEGTEVDRETMQWFASQVQAHKPFCGLPVRLRGGYTITLEPVFATDGHLGEEKFLTENTIDVEGTYVGLNIMQLTDPTFGEVFRVFHVVETSVAVSYDAMGNLETKSYRTYVTAYDSDVRITGYVGSHKYQDIKSDPVCAHIDELVVNDEMPDDDKLHRLARMFERPTAKYDAIAEKDKQRISYLNHLGFLSGRSLAVRFLLAEAEGEYSEDGSRVHNVVFSSNDEYYLVEVDTFEQCDRIVFDYINTSRDPDKVVLGVRGSNDAVGGEVIVPYHSEMLLVNEN